MSSSPKRGYVLKTDDAHRARPARISADLMTTPYLAYGVADPRLVDPHMEAVVEEAKEEARRAGYAGGYADGHEIGRREGLELLAAQQREIHEQDAAERAARRERLVQLLASVEDAVVAALDYQAPAVEEMRDLIAGLAVDIAEELVGHHLRVEDCGAKDALLRALSKVPRRATVTVRLHPEDVAAVQEFAGAVSDWDIARLVADPAVTRGDAYAEADNLEVESSIGDAMERIRKVLAP